MREGQRHVRDYDVRGMPAGELDRTRRELAASLALARPGSPIRVPLEAHISAIDAELAERTADQSHGLPDSPLPSQILAGLEHNGLETRPGVARCRGVAMSAQAHGLGSDGGGFPLSSSRGPILIRARTIAGRSSFLARITAKTAATPTSEGGTARTT